jgi:hypothetical protein
MGFEPTTASLEGWNSTTELRPPFLTFLVHSLIKPKTLRCAPGSPTRKLASHASPHINLNLRVLSRRQEQYDWLRVEQALYGGQARIRTLEDISQQIYSLPPLATWVPARDVSLFYTNQIAAQIEDALAAPTAQRQIGLPVHSFLPQSSKD